jgi:integrase
MTSSARPAEAAGDPDQGRIAHHTRCCPGKHRALIVTALFNGLRASELRGLRWNAVDLKRGVITVKGRVDAWGDFGMPKTSAGERDIRWHRWQSTH